MANKKSPTEKLFGFGSILAIIAMVSGLLFASSLPTQANSSTAQATALAQASKEVKGSLVGEPKPLPAASIKSPSDEGDTGVTISAPGHFESCKSTTYSASVSNPNGYELRARMQSSIDGKIQDYVGISKAGNYTVKVDASQGQHPDQYGTVDASIEIGGEVYDHGVKIGSFGKEYNVWCRKPPVTLTPPPTVIITPTQVTTPTAVSTAIVTATVVTTPEPTTVATAIVTPTQVTTPTAVSTAIVTPTTSFTMTTPPAPGPTVTVTPTMPAIYKPMGLNWKIRTECIKDGSILVTIWYESSPDSNGQRIDWQEGGYINLQTLDNSRRESFSVPGKIARDTEYTFEISTAFVETVNVWVDMKDAVANGDNTGDNQVKNVSSCPKPPTATPPPTRRPVKTPPPSPTSPVERFAVVATGTPVPAPTRGGAN